MRASGSRELYCSIRQASSCLTRSAVRWSDVTPARRRRSRAGSGCCAKSGSGYGAHRPGGAGLWDVVVRVPGKRARDRQRVPVLQLLLGRARSLAWSRTLRPQPLEGRTRKSGSRTTVWSSSTVGKGLQGFGSTFRLRMWRSKATCSSTTESPSDGFHRNVMFGNATADHDNRRSFETT